MKASLSEDDIQSAVDAIAFLARSSHRVGVLIALSDESRSRDDLRQLTGASSPTMGRVLSDFENRSWVSRDGHRYELTRLGAFVAGRFGGLCEAMGTERKLREIWEWLPTEMEGFSVDLFAEPVVSFPGPGYPYEPVDRVTHLIESADSMRGFGTTVVKSGNLEAACNAILDGMEFEFIYAPGVLETIVQWNPEKVAAAARCENCTTFVHEALPDSETCGLGIYDHRVGICCHDRETGVLQAGVDTNSPMALDWAETMYDRYRTEATRLDSTELTAF